MDATQEPNPRPVLNRSRESASLEWLHRDREQVQTLLVESFLALVREVLPAVEAAGGVTQTSQP
jgi:hypothetical protein